MNFLLHLPPWRRIIMIRELVLGALTPNQTRYGGEPSRRILPEEILCNLLENGSV